MAAKKQAKKSASKPSAKPSKKPAPKVKAKQKAPAPKPKAKPAPKAPAPKPKAKAVPKAAPKPKAAPAKAKASAKARVNPVIHWEIQSTQADALHRFYSEVFGWKIDANNPMQYGLVASKGANGIDGGIGASPHDTSKVVVYAAVTDINATLSRIEMLGGRTVMPRSDLGMVVMALYLDPEGNTMGLVEDR
jgi:predicted enzyme related to lactoylglutathione lyase